MLVDARLNIEEFEEYYEVEVPREKFDTIGGYIVEHCGRVPAVGERIKVENFEMLIEQGSQRVIRQVRIFPQQVAEVEGNDS